MNEGEIAPSLKSAGKRESRPPRGAVVLAWSGWALCIVMIVGSRIAKALLPLGATSEEDSPLFTAVLIIFAATFATVGAVVAARRPRNPIGWIYLASTLVFCLGAPAEVYADWYFSTGGGSLTVASLLVSITTWAWMPPVLLPPTFGLLLFPEGHLPSRRWRWVGWAAAAGVIGMWGGTVLTPDPIQEGDLVVDNYFGVDALGTQFFEAVQFASLPLIVVALIASPISLIARWKRSQGLERQQVKWVAFAAALAATVFIGASIAGGIMGDDAPLSDLINVLTLLAILLIPIGAGIAILKHRLYDIDRLINKTLVYGIVTVSLGAAYFFLVIGLRRLMSDFTSSSELTVALSTLAIFTLMSPLRRRVQGFVDARFYRRRYDARLRVEEFSLRLRAEMQTPAIVESLTEVVADTVGPREMGLWVRR